MAVISRAELEAFYCGELTGELAELALRSLRARLKAALVFTFMAALCFIWFGYVRGDASSSAAKVLDALLPIASIAVTVIFYGLSYAGLNAAFKRNVVPKILNLIAPEMAYTPEACVRAEDFKASKLYEFDRWSGSDLFAGKYGGAHIRFSEFKAEALRESGRRRRVWKTTFKGVFFVADLQRKFTGRTYVLPDLAERMLGKFFGGIVHSLKDAGWGRGEAIRLENDPEFESRFAVFSTDPEEAMLRLTPELTSRMCAMYDRCGGMIGFAFINSDIYIAMPSETNRFELHAKGSFRDVERLVEEIGTFLIIVDIMELTDQLPE